VLGLRRGLADWVYEWFQSRNTRRAVVPPAAQLGEAKHDKLA